MLGGTRAKEADRRRNDIMRKYYFILLALLIVMVSCRPAQEPPNLGDVRSSFVPDSFEVPATLETDRFRLRMLSVDEVEKDYEAVMESRELLHAQFGGSWPREGFTLQENLADLERHQREFEQREAFAYTVVGLDESRVLGCVYINPSEDGDTDARVYMWVRQSEFDKGLDPILFETVKKWLDETWPFERIKYPRRDTVGK